MDSRKKPLHNWRLLKWPFTVTFLYFSLLSLLTGASEAGEAGFFGVLGLALICDALIYLLYCRFLSRDRDDTRKLWAVFFLFYGILTIPQLQTLWSMLKTRF